MIGNTKGTHWLYGQRMPYGIVPVGGRQVGEASVFGEGGMGETIGNNLRLLYPFALV